MKPPSFEYYDPATVAEAIGLLGRYGPDARILAGGQSLVALLNFRLSTPAVLVDINRIGELSYIKEENGRLHFGAVTRQRAVEFSPLVQRRLPLLVEATRLVGHLPTRTRGTIGGSIAHADPAAEYPAVVTALDGEMVIQGGSGKRVVGPKEFFQGFLTTAIQPGEMLVEIRLPVMPPKAGWAFEEFSRRHGDFAIAGIAAMVVAEGERCRIARLAASGVGGNAVRLRSAEEILERGRLDEKNIEDAATRAAELVDPAGDIHASADYRRHLTRVLTRRAINRALARSREAAGQRGTGNG
jgi:CO/xanthine dehydrogenase FAD-binding subunit